jgi:hypothetical protein
MPPRATTPTHNTKRSPGKASSKYDYVELANAALIGDENHNFYGVIVDATFPY